MSTQQSHVTVTAPDSRSTWQAILAAIFAAFHAAEPIIVHVVPPPIARGLEIGDTVGQVAVPIIIATTVQQ